ncbi:MAG: hypothetical protein AAB933_02545 [Patescibacteria group bacterium]
MENKSVFIKNHALKLVLGILALALLGFSGYGVLFYLVPLIIIFLSFYSVSIVSRKFISETDSVSRNTFTILFGIMLSAVLIFLFYYGSHIAINSR